ELLRLPSESAVEEQVFERGIGVREQGSIRIHSDRPSLLEQLVDRVFMRASHLSGDDVARHAQGEDARCLTVTAEAVPKDTNVVLVEKPDIRIRRVVRFPQVHRRLDTGDFADSQSLLQPPVEHTGVSRLIAGEVELDYVAAILDCEVGEAA